MGYGKGREAACFAALTHSVNYPTILLSPDDETLLNIGVTGCESRRLPDRVFTENPEADARTAVLLFFHDHDREPALLLGALDTPAFYIGAQGSQRAREERHRQLASLPAG
ncbi:XdhC family protein [Ruegeria pomeroyi]|nr:XdhC family protein [Ruegeria pomeroyi]